MKLLPSESEPAVPGGELGALLRSHDWSRTKLGPVESWPRSLRTYVSMILEMPAPAIIFWGEELVQLYNDGYAVIMGPRHPRFLGATYRECWPDTYPVIHPWMRKVLETGEVIQVEKTFFLLTRHGFNEEAYFTFDFSPLRDDQGAIAGILQPVFEVTDVVLGERRLETLRSVAPRNDSPHGAMKEAIQALAGNAKDLPFALIFQWDREAERLELAASSGLDGHLDREPAVLARLTEVARQAVESNASVSIDSVEALLGARHAGPWPEPTEHALALPMRRTGADDLRGVVILGISPRLRFDATYRQFFDDLARELATQRALEQKKRAEREAFAREQAARAQAEAEVARRADAEAALRASEERLRMALEAGQLGVVELQSARGVLEWDARALQLVGLAPGRTPLLEEAVARIHPEDADRAKAIIQQALRPGAGTARLECRVQGWDGVERSILAMVKAHFDAHGQPDRVVGTLQDVTEQRSVEAEREGLLARERAAREEAEDANRLKDEFLATVSHELRTPLTAVLGWVQLLRAGTLPPDKRERAIATVERNARAQGQLIEDLLDVSRIMTGKLKLEVSSVDVSHVVEAALESLRPAAEAKGIRMQAALDSAGSIMGDASRLQQVVWNLLSNAVKFTPRGGRVQVLVERRDSSVEISVSDTGQGIPARFLPHVFERFRQADGSTTRQAGGLGLGLAIVRHLVELHGGTVSATSEGEGRGATFVVSLPQAVAVRRDVVVPPSLRGPPQAQDVTGPPRLDGLRLLVVDDEEDTRELLRSLLETCGGTVATAGSSEEALSVLRREPFDVLVSDIGMPGEDGYHLISRVRALPPEHGGDIASVALTAYTRMEDRTRVLLAGFNSHVPKPIEPMELMAVIASLVTRRGTGRA